MSKLIQLFKDSFNYKGRFSRSEFAIIYFGMIGIMIVFWCIFFVLFAVISTILHLEPSPNLLTFLIWAPLILYLIFHVYIVIGAGVRRLNDMGWSGWLIILAFLPCTNIIMLILLLATPGKQFNSI